MRRAGLWCALALAGCAAGQVGVTAVRAPSGSRATGWSAYLDGQLPAARASFEETLAAHPHDARARFGLATMAHERGDWERAWGLWLALLERPSTDPLWPAMAETAAHKIEVLFGEVPGMAAQAARLSALPLAPLPIEARRRVLSVEAAYARRAGDEPRGRTLDRAAGCPDRWLTGATFGTLSRLDLDTQFPPDRGDLGGFHDVGTRGCRVTLEGSTGRAGVLYAAGFFHAQRRQPATLVVDSDAPYRLFVDGVELRQVDRDRYPPRRRQLETTLSAGWHRVLLKIGAAAGRTELELALFADPPLSPFVGAVEDAPRALGSASAFAPRLTPRAARSTPPGATFSQRESELLADLLELHAALRSGDLDRGEAPAQRLLAGAPRFAPGRLAAAQAWAEDPSRPARFARDRARREIVAALILDPTLLRARYNLATIALETDHPREALDRLAEAPPETRPNWRIEYARYQADKARGWKREADDALAHALRLNPEACPALVSQVNERRERHDVEGALRLARSAITCEGGSDVYAETLRTTGDLTGAAREYRRLLALDPQRETLRSGLSDVLMETGDSAGAVAELELLVRRAPRIAAYRQKLADALSARGELDRARKVIEDGLGEIPESQELSRALRALCPAGAAGRRTPCAEILDPFRLDGKDVIAAFERRRGGRAYDAPAVLVLDRTVTRVFATGARLTLTHNIIKVLAKDGLDKWGEVKIPDGADVLVLRTVKADGSTREPEEIAEKEGISVPDLEVGDYVEFEYVDPAAPPAAFPGGFIAERFFFGSYDAPLDRSEYLLVTPAGMPVTVDRRSGAPKEVLEHRGALDVRGYFASGMPQLFAEPASTPFVEFVPSVRPGSEISFARWKEFLRDQQLFALRGNAQLRALAAKESAAAATPAAKVAALDGWVRRHIHHGGSLDDPATAILARGEGNRVTLLAALARAIGLTPEVWLARSVRAARLDGGLPELEAFDQPLLAVSEQRAPGAAATTKTVAILDPRYRHSAAGFITPALRGVRALKLGAGAAAEFVTVPNPKLGAGDDQRIMDVEATLEPDGAAELRVRETLTGWPALEWREGLEKLAPDRLRPGFEQHTLGFYFPGAVLKDLTFSGKDDDAGPFHVEYRFRAPAWARAVGGRLVVPAPYPALLQRRYAGAAERKTALDVEYVPPTITHTRVKVPAGAKLALLPPVARSIDAAATKSLDGAAPALFEQRAVPTATGFELSARFSMPDLRLAPDHYRALVDFAAQVDLAEARAAEVALPSASR